MQHMPYALMWYPTNYLKCAGVAALFCLFLKVCKDVWDVDWNCRLAVPGLQHLHVCERQEQSLPLPRK